MPNERLAGAPEGARWTKCDPNGHVNRSVGDFAPYAAEPQIHAAAVAWVTETEDEEADLDERL